MIMGDQKFICGRHKNRTFEDVKKNDPDFCAKVLKATACNKYFPEEFKLYLLSRSHPFLHESSVGGFIRRFTTDMRAEFQSIIGAPEIKIRPVQVHSQAFNEATGNRSIFIRYFVKKCIFNIQNVNASSHCIDTFARIFPFKVSKMVSATKLPICELFDEEFYSTIAGFMTLHFGDRSDSAHVILDLFLGNVYDFKLKHFDESAMYRLEKAVNSDQSSVGSTYVVDYLKQFPRLKKVGVNRYTQLRQMYNDVCAAFERAGLGDQPRRQIQTLPEINCYQLLQLLNPDFYAGEREKYMNWFKKYLFFFVYAIDSADDHPVFFIDDPLYECLLYYIEYQNSREPPENLKLCLWMMALVHRRTQSLYFKKLGLDFEVDEKNLQHVREYVENFPGIESAKVDYRLPTNVLSSGIPIVTEDTVFSVCYCKKPKTNWPNVYKGIIRALVCPFNVKKVVIYNAWRGVEASFKVPPLKKKVLEFIRQHNEYDPDHPKPVEYMLTKDLEYFFVEDTIQWDDKYLRKSNSIPVLEYKEIFADA